MTLEEAIKINQQIRIKHWDDFSNKELHAISLGIEALKRERDGRDSRIPGWNTPLPGETEE